MADLNGVEIFKVGTWKGLPFDERDLDDIVKNFEELRDVHKVPLKLGHSGDRDTPKGMPALGWVKAVRRVGEKLVADFTNVPSKLVEAIRQKRYRTVSIELLMGARMGQKVFGHLLDAVALLGAEQPAVLGLGDLDQFLAERRAAFDGSGRRVMFETIAGNERGDMDMTKEELEKLLEERDKKLFERFERLMKVGGSDDDEMRKQLNAERDAREKAEREARKLREEREEFERKAKKEAIEAKRKDAKDALEQAVKAKRITPAQRDFYTRSLQLDDDTVVERLDIKEFRQMFDAKVPDDKSKGFDNTTDDGDVDAKSPAEQLVALTREHMAKHGVKDFNEALQIVCAANRELHRKYLFSNGEVH